MNEDRSSRYQRLKRQAEIASLGWSILLLALFMLSGASVAFRSAAEAIAPRSFFHHPATVTIYVIAVAIASELAGAPLSFYSGYVLERRYGLSNERLGSWLFDELKSLALLIVFSSVAATVVYAFIRRSPESWWLPAGAIFAILIVGLANL